MASALASKSCIAQAPKAVFAGKRRSARASSVVVRAEETSLAKQTERIQQKGIYINFASEQSLSYLDGTYAGDNGFDPLGLLDPQASGGFITPEWLRYSEVIHCRFAMLGAAGCVGPEALGKLGLVPPETGDVIWWKSGVMPPFGTYDHYWSDPYTIFFVNYILIQFAELRRWQDFRHPGSMGKQYFLGLERVLGGQGDPSYPGGQFFNLFNLGSTEESMKQFKNNEIENGRLAMLSCMGYSAQAVMTGKGPIQNLIDHVQDPVHNNILANLSKVYGQAP